MSLKRKKFNENKLQSYKNVIKIIFFFVFICFAERLAQEKDEKVRLRGQAGTKHKLYLTHKTCQNRN